MVSLGQNELKKLSLVHKGETRMPLKIVAEVNEKLLASQFYMIYTGLSLQ